MFRSCVSWLTSACSCAFAVDISLWTAFCASSAPTRRERISFLSSSCSFFIDSHEENDSFHALSARACSAESSERIVATSASRSPHSCSRFACTSFKLLSFSTSEASALSTPFHSSVSILSLSMPSASAESFTSDASLLSVPPCDSILS